MAHTWNDAGPPWRILSAAGTVLPPAEFPGLSQQAVIIPEFADNQSLTLIELFTELRRGGPVARSRLRRIQLATGQDAPLFLPAHGEFNPTDAIPAANGNVWVVEFPLYPEYSPRLYKVDHRLRRLTASGQANSIDRTVPGAAVKLLAGPEGTFMARASYYLPISGGPGWVHELYPFAESGSAGVSFSSNGLPPFLPERQRSIIMNEATSMQSVMGREPTRLIRRLSDGSEDPAFQPGISASRLNRLQDESILADGRHRLRASDGAPLPGWSVPDLSRPGRVSLLLPSGNGGVYTAGDFVTADAQPRPGIARWHADGTLDRSFAPAEGRGTVLSAAVLTDGSVAVLRRQSGRSTLQRLLADGTPDPGFEWPPDAFWEAPLEEIGKIAAAPGGEILAVVNWLNPVSNTTVLGVSPQGGARVIKSGDSGTGYHFLPLPDGRFFLDGKLHTAHGQLDPGFQTDAFAPLAAAGGGYLFTDYGGRLHFVEPGGSLRNAFVPPVDLGGIVTATEGALQQILVSHDDTVTRLYPDGRRDPAWKEPVLLRRNEGIPSGMPIFGGPNALPASAECLLLHPVTGQLWIAGDFTRVNGQFRPGVAVLDATSPSNFTDWIATIFQDSAIRGPETDPDEDGASNWLEYAAGTSPEGARSRPATEILTLPSLCVRAPRNPLATEIVTVLEVSPDLLQWRTATAAEAIRKPGIGQDSYALTPPTGRAWFRIRYRSL